MASISNRSIYLRQAPSQNPKGALVIALAALPEQMSFMKEPKDVDKVIADAQSLLEAVGLPR